MTTHRKLNRDEVNTADQKLIDGLTKKKDSLASLNFGNATHATTDIIDILKQRITTANAVDQPRATWLAAVQANRDVRAKTASIVSGARQALQVMFAGSLETLAEFGLKPRKLPVALTSDEKAAAALKAKATRKARNTMGPRQKAKIKGTVPATAPATSSTASTPTASSSPAVAPRS
jgi:hypothetical protein